MAVYVIWLQAKDDEDILVARGLRALLKRALRTYGLKCIRIEIQRDQP